MSRIPVTILTGFLGAGKTTLLARLMAEPGFGRTAVVVNEFGEVGLDGHLVTPADGTAFAMTAGCLCCTVAGDVRLTLLRLAEEAATRRGPQFDRVVIETTGLADPAPVLHAFMSDMAMLDAFALNGVVTVVDAVTGESALDRFKEARRQAAVADLILLSKTDLAQDPASRRDLERLRERLARDNPNAAVMDAGQARAADLFSLAAFDPAGKPPEVAAWLRHTPHQHNHDHHDRNRHGSDVTAFCLGSDRPVEAGALEDALGALQASLGPDLLRLKGLIRLTDPADRPLLLHAVQHLRHPPALLPCWPAGLSRSRLVVIAAGPGRDQVPGLIAAFLPGFAPETPQMAEAAS